MNLTEILNLISNVAILVGFITGLYSIFLNIYIARNFFEPIYKKLTAKPVLANDIVYKTWYLIDYAGDSVFSLKKKLNDPESGYDRLTKRELTLLRKYGFSLFFGFVLFFGGISLSKLI